MYGESGDVLGERRFIASGRKIRPTDDAMVVLQAAYGRFGFENVRSVFGFTQEYSPLYGGRGGRTGRPFLTDAQIDAMRDNGITFDLVLSNHLFSEEAYQATRPILEKHHRAGNGVVCQNDELAKRIRAEFPEYNLRASMIKGLDTPEAIEAALDLYDYVTLPIKKSDDGDLLTSIVRKDRVIVFANAFCAYFCPTTPCYEAISKAYFNPAVTRTRQVCTLTHKTCNYIEFDLNDPIYDGYFLFKLVPPILKRLGRITGRSRSQVSKKTSGEPE